MLQALTCSSLPQRSSLTRINLSVFLMEDGVNTSLLESNGVEWSRLQSQSAIFTLCNCRPAPKELALALGLQRRSFSEITPRSDIPPSLPNLCCFLLCFTGIDLPVGQGQLYEKFSQLAARYRSTSESNGTQVHRIRIFPRTVTLHHCASGVSCSPAECFPAVYPSLVSNRIGLATGWNDWLVSLPSNVENSGEQTHEKPRPSPPNSSYYPIQIKLILCSRIYRYSAIPAHSTHHLRRCTASSETDKLTSWL